MSAEQTAGADDKKTERVTKKPRPRRLNIPGLTGRMEDYWVRRGYLKPGLEFPHRPGGRGNRRTWNDEETRIATDMVRLRAAGYTVQRAALYARVGPETVEAALRSTPEVGR